MASQIDNNMAEEYNEDSAYRDNLWKIIETGMPAKVPTYIKNILHLSGYEDISVLRNFDVVKIEKLEQFTRNKILDLLDVPTPNEIELKKYFHFYNKNSTKFEIIEGHKDMLLAIGVFVDNSIKLRGNDYFSLKVTRKVQLKNSGLQSGRQQNSSGSVNRSVNNLNQLSDMLYKKLKNWCMEKKLTDVSIIVCIYRGIYIILLL